MTLITMWHILPKNPIYLHHIATRYTTTSDVWISVTLIAGNHPDKLLYLGFRDICHLFSISQGEIDSALSFCLMPVASFSVNTAYIA